MTEYRLLLKNSSLQEIELIVEPYVHVYKIGADQSVLLAVDDDRLEVEYLPTGITVYVGGIPTVSKDGVELEPGFLR